MSVVCGRDGRPLVTTRQAAYAMGWRTAGQFRKWAARKQIKAKAYRATGRTGQPEALWDLADITTALAEQDGAGQAG